MLTSYAPSGRVPTSILVLLPLAMVLSAAAAWPYNQAISVVRHPKLDALILALFAGAAALAARATVRAGKCRSPAIAAGIGLLMALSAVIASWALVYSAAAAAPGGPASFLDYLRDRAATGTVVRRRHNGGPSISGFGMYVLWSIEALALVGAGIAGAVIAAIQPFCESCNTWATRANPETALENASADTITHVASARTLGELLTPPLAPSPESTDRLVYAVTTCPRCDALGFLTVRHESVQAAKKGKGKTTSRTLHEKIPLDAPHLGAVRSLHEDLTTAADLPADSTSDA